MSWTSILFEAIDDAVFVYDEAGNILEANPAACRRLGYAREELLRLNTRDIDDPEFASGYESRLNSQLQTGQMRCEGVHRSKDGKRIHVDIYTSKIELNGMPAVLAVMRDISARKETEATLAKQTHLLQSILDNMSDAIVVSDASDQIVLFNPQAERIFGLGLIQSACQLYHADRITRLPTFPTARCVGGESFDALELFVRHADAPAGLWISVAGRPLRERDGSIKGGVIVCHDISNHKRSERRAHVQHEVARVIASGEGTDLALAQIMRLLCEELDCEAGVLWQTESTRDQFRRRLAWRHPRFAEASFGAVAIASVSFVERDLPPAVRREGKLQTANTSDAPWATLPRWVAARQAGLQTVLAVPIASGEEIIGVLEFWSQTFQEEEPAFLDLIRSGVNQIGQYLHRERVEKELRDSEALYISLVESLPQNIFRKDQMGRVTYANKRYCESLNRSAEQLLGKTDFDLFPEHLAAKYVADDRELMRLKSTLDTVEEHRLPDGNRLFVHVVKTPVLDADGHAIGVQGIFWDVTQETLVNEAITSSERRYRQLTEATMDGIILIDADGAILLFNPAAERMFGYIAAEILGENASRLIPGEFQDVLTMGVGKPLRARLADLIGKPHEFHARRKDGSEFPVEIALSSLIDPNASAQPFQVLAAIRDLTERNRMRAVLVQNEKLASIGLLSAGVAHEINNPLAFVANNLVVLERENKGILATLDLYESSHPIIKAGDPVLADHITALQQEIDLPYIRANLARIVSRTRDGIDRVTRIVHSLRGMARTAAPRKQDTSITDLINSSLEILAGKYKHLGIVVEQNHDPNPVVSCVSTQISQVVLNLLVNAFQAVEAHHPQGGQINILTQRIQDEMLIEIADNGGGVKPEALPRLFDPFFTTKDVGEGTGLGLSISHSIVSAHGGRIEVDTKVGEGTRFRVFLPLKESRNPR